MIILNELKYAKYVYDNKILDDKPSFTISLLCKYFIQVLNMSEMETVIAIDNFMKETYPNYIDSEWYTVILKNVKNASFPLFSFIYILQNLLLNDIHIVVFYTYIF